MLEIMLPAVFPVQAQVPVQAPVQAPVAVPVVVNVPLVAAGVQQLVGQVQDLVIQHVAIAPVAMEVEDDNEILKRLFLKKFGRELPETERNEVDDIDMNLIDLTKEDDEDEMEVAAPNAVVVVKTESIETPETPDVPADDRRRSSRLERLRKSEFIPEKEAPLAAGTSVAENVIADNDTDMAEDKSVESVNTVEPLTADEAFEMAEAAIAESDAAIAANQKEMDKFFK
jgi:hypothetical protein